jgi:sphingolipid delta-4 desaturase
MSMPLAAEPVARAQGRSPQARRHRELRRLAVESVPDSLRLAGPNPWTAFAVPLLIAVHWTTAWAAGRAPLWLVFVLAFTIGQTVIHSGGSLVHETAHRLIFRRRRPKLLFDLGLELLLGSFGRQLTYQCEHTTSHHPYQGDYERDYEFEDVCAILARRSLTRSHPGRQRAVTALTLLLHLLPGGFLLGDEILPRLYATLTGRTVKDTRRTIGARRPTRRQRVLFISASLLGNALLFALFGARGWLYHFWALSLFLGKCGVWNLGQSLSEHAGDDLVSPTRSTYWWGNRLLFNTGYHLEHHVFPDVPWNRLPALTALAPTVFNVASDKSYVGWWWDHVRRDFSPSRRNPSLDSAQTAERCS